MSTIKPIPSLILTHAAQLLTLQGLPGPRRGTQLRELAIINDGAVLIANGKIVAVGTTDAVSRHPLARQIDLQEIDCTGRVVLPGFVDSHTHPVFVAPRLVDFEKRIAGASYEDIAEAGGGIRSSIHAVRKAPRNVLAQKVLATLTEMARYGTTTVEAKSGYGLSVESEIKSLEAIRDAARQWPGAVAPTLLGAHVVPPEYRDNSGEYVRIVCEEMIPAVARAKLADYVDVFCERGAFTVEQTERILGCSTNHGFGLRVHVCQLSRAELLPLLKFRPASVDHLDRVSEADIPALAKTDTVATLLPAANYFLGLQIFPAARKLIDAGVAVALATDHNPGTAPTSSMPFVLSAACTHLKMSPAEAIVAATYNGACALGLESRKGSLHRGKEADIAVFDAQDYRELAYWIGVNRCCATILNGILQPRLAGS